MHSGVVTAENLSSLLRNISQKRQQGVLEIRLGDQQVNILFVQGKIVDSVPVGTGAVQDVIHNCQKSGLLPKNFETHAQTYSELYEAISDASNIFPEIHPVLLNEESFKNIVQHQIIERLYSIDLNSGVGYYQFKLQMIEFDKEFSANVSIGQLLLDLAAIPVNNSRFAELFSSETSFRLTGKEFDSPNFEEQYLLDLLADGRNISVLESRSILSSFHFRECLLVFFDQGIIEIADGVSTIGHNNELKDDISYADILAAVDSTLEAVLGEVSEELNVEGETVPKDKKNYAEVSAEPEVENGQITVNTQAKIAGPKFSLHLYNARLMQKSWVVHLVVLIFLLAACLSPLLKWGQMFGSFADF